METGSISHGTLREEDLVPTFLSVIREESEETAVRIETDYQDAIAHLTSGLEPNPDDIQSLMETLYDTLDGMAPAGYRFGAHEGDGSDFGFWKVDSVCVEGDHVNDDNPNDSLCRTCRDWIVDGT